MTDKGWVKAGELHEGSKVLNSRKEYEVVESIEYKGYNGINVYNLIVENYHTFFITELGLMVHNIDCKNATLGQIFKQVGDNISDTKIKGEFEDVINKLDDIAGRNNIEEYIKKFDSRFRGLDPNNLDEIKKIISDTSKDIDNHSSSLFKGTEGVSNPKIGESALNHSSVGDFTYNPKTGKVSKMKGGGHGQANIDFLEKNGLKYEIVDTYPNGVRVGNVADHKVKGKRTGTNQSWFPESWSESDIVNAGEYIGNLKENINAVDGVISYGEVNGVRVGVIRTDGKISTIFPDATMQP